MIDTVRKYRTTEVARCNVHDITARSRRNRFLSADITSWILAICMYCKKLE